MTEGYRNIDEAVSEDFVKSLKDITGEQVRSAMRLQASPAGAARVLNRIHNMQHRAKAKEITAGMLVSNGYEYGAEVSIPSVDAKGQLVNVLDINNDTTIAVTIQAKFVRNTFLVERGDTVVIWPVEYKQPNRELREAGMRPRITPVPRPSYISDPGYATVSAHAVKRMPSDYLGRRVIADGGQIDGILREVEVHRTAPNSVIFKVDGESHQLTASEPVRVYPKEERILTEGYLKAEYIASHLTTFFGKRVAIKNQATGKLEELRVNADNPNHYIFVVNGVKVIVHEDATVLVYGPEGFLRPGPYPWGSSTTPPPRPGQNPFLASPRTVTPGPVAARRQAAARRRDEMVPDTRPLYTMTAYGVATNNSDFRGRRVNLRNKHLGTLTDYSIDNEGKVILVIDGVMFKANYGDVVRIYRKGN